MPIVLVGIDDVAAPTEDPGLKVAWRSTELDVLVPELLFLCAFDAEFPFMLILERDVLLLTYAEIVLGGALLFSLLVLGPMRLPSLS